MKEARRSYRINTLSLQELNFILQQLGDRFDELEGRRGTPAFKSNVDLDGNRITDSGAPVDSTDVAIKGSVDTLETSVNTSISTINSSITALVAAQTGSLNKAGISGGQVAYGGTGAGESLILFSTTNSTKGWVGYADSNGTVLHGWKG